jgi:hypothetical protein
MREATRKSGSRGNSLQPFDEQTFRYLLRLEQRRSDRSGRPFVLVLVDTAPTPGDRTPLDVAVAASIFSELSQYLRETDFIGWYEEGVRAGAVLTEFGDASGAEISKLINDKVLTRGLLPRLPPDVARKIQIETSRYPLCDTTHKSRRLPHRDR